MMNPTLPLHLLWLLVMLLGIHDSVSAQATALVHGRLESASGVRDIKLAVDDRYADGQTDSYPARIGDDGRFAFEVRLQRPQLVQISYARQVTEVYLAPGDTLYIEAKASLFPYDMGFGAKAASDNHCYYSYMKQFPKNHNEFEQKQYKSGAHWFLVPPKMDGMMQRMSAASFTQTMKARKREREAFMDNYRSRFPGELSPSFIRFMQAEIDYEYGYYMLCYGDIFRYKHAVQPSFFDEALLPLYPSELGNAFYREYLKGYVNHHYMEIHHNNVEGILGGQYELAPNYLSGEELAYFRSDLLAVALYGKKLALVEGQYHAFLRDNDYPSYGNKVGQAYRKAVKHHDGSPAPTFSLLDRDGKQVSLAFLRGKPVYLNFWATWCQPCVSKMERMAGLQRELEAQGMVFLHLSLDRDAEAWQSFLRQRGYGGTHALLKGGVAHSVAKDYNVRAIPQYFIIDKYGNLAPKPETDGVAELEEMLRRALR